jgi:23S rRNA (guanosine2251-2'-O)-methyltransferase
MTIFTDCIAQDELFSHTTDMPDIVIIANNLRSTHNVGSLLRTADGMGVNKVYLTGYTPYPASINDDRLPHLAQKIDKQISKTALGAEKFVDWAQVEDAVSVISDLRLQGFKIVALEQAPGSVSLSKYISPNKIALVLGREVEGVEDEILAICDDIIEIEMKGQKESLNVIQAAAIAMYQLSISDNKF